MAKVLIYTKKLCGYCNEAKTLLDKKNQSYEEINIDKVAGVKDYLMNLTAWDTVPQIFINDKFIGGYEELYKLDVSKELDKLLQE